MIGYNKNYLGGCGLYNNTTRPTGEWSAQLCAEMCASLFDPEGLGPIVQEAIQALSLEDISNDDAPKGLFEVALWGHYVSLALGTFFSGGSNHYGMLQEEYHVEDGTLLVDGAFVCLDATLQESTCVMMMAVDIATGEVTSFELSPSENFMPTGASLAEEMIEAFQAMFNDLGTGLTLEERQKVAEYFTALNAKTATTNTEE